MSKDHDDDLPFDYFVRWGAVRPKPHRGVIHMGEPIMAFQLHDSEQVSIEVEALDSEGNPADATTVITSSDEAVVGCTDNGDGTALLVASPGAAGLGTSTVTATVTNKDDGVSLTGSFDVEVIAGDAVAVNIIPGTPEAKPVV
jgi:hypothetical protein